VRTRRTNPPDPIATWKRLSLATQFGIAREVAARRAAAFKRTYKNVLSVGPGYRTRGAHRALKEEVCLRFLLIRKWKARRKGSVPLRILALATLRGRKIAVAIPTDVDVLGRGEPQATNDLGPGIVVRGNGKELRGAACCLVEEADDASASYLLGCHHVLTGSSANPGCGAMPGMEVYRADDGRLIGPTMYWAPLTAAAGRGMDAALARVDDTSAVVPVHSGVPIRRVAPAGLPGPYRIATPRGWVTATYVSEQYGGPPLPYKCGAAVSISPVLESIASTVGGDSGSPLLGADGTLYGMHFYQTDQGRSLAIPAWKLFEPGLFAIDIDLHT
jgi:hypothetical protein